MHFVYEFISCVPNVYVGK